MCDHKRTQIWEPHLAGARKCLDCLMVYNPNREPAWFIEDLRPRARIWWEGKSFEVIEGECLLDLVKKMDDSDRRELISLCKQEIDRLV